MKLWRLLWAVLREIADENAYSRYLASRGLVASRESWRDFSEQRMGAKYRKPKCC
jgi:hypothetical protein